MKGMTSLTGSGSAWYCCLTAGLSMSMSSFTPRLFEKSGTFHVFADACKSAATRARCCRVLSRRWLRGAHHAAAPPGGTACTPAGSRWQVPGHYVIALHSFKRSSCFMQPCKAAEASERNECFVQYCTCCCLIRDHRKQLGLPPSPVFICSLRQK